MKRESFIAVTSPLSIIRTLSGEERSLRLQLIKLLQWLQNYCLIPTADVLQSQGWWKGPSDFLEKRKKKKSTEIKF